MLQSRKTKVIWLISDRVATSDDAQWQHITFDDCRHRYSCRKEYWPTLVVGSQLTRQTLLKPNRSLETGAPDSRNNYQGAI